MNPDDWINESITAFAEKGIGCADPTKNDLDVGCVRNDELRGCYVLFQETTCGRVLVSLYRLNRFPVECVFRTHFDPKFAPCNAAIVVEDLFLREHRFKEDCRQRQKSYNNMLAYRIWRRRCEIMYDPTTPENLDWWPLIQGSEEMAEDVLMSLK